MEGGMTHRLDPLLRPRSIAVVGATPRAGAVGQRTVLNLLQGGFAGPLYAVNPRYTEVAGVRCFPSLAALPEQVEQVVFAVSDERIEEALEDAIEHGARAATIMSSLVLAEDGDPPLRERIRARVHAAGLVLCGGNGMGYYNFHDGVWACGFATRAHARGGNVALLSQSGAGMCGILDVEERIDFNLAVSTGQELSVTLDEYLDFALEMPGTRAVGLFVETIRAPDRFRAALAKARAKRIPVVAIKVGRTELAARLAISHSGAMTGSDAAFDAVCERYGVQRVRDMDELATTLIMFAQPHPVGEGGLVSIHDSGGERQLAIDVAAEVGVPFTTLSPESTKALEAVLDPGLPAVNPLDAWSAGGPDAHVKMQQALGVLMSDPNAAFGAVIHDRVAGGGIYTGYLDYLRAGHAASGKPAFLVANRQGTGSDPQVIAATREGFPVLDGLRPFLVGAKCLLAYRDHLRRPEPAAPEPPAGARERWLARLARGDVLDELEASALLRDYGLPMNVCERVASEDEARMAAERFRSPVVLKSLAPGLHHRSDVGGVVLDLRDGPAITAAYRALAGRLGPDVLVAPMVEPGVEMLLGLVHDDQYGPLVVLGFGGVHAEILGDVRSLLPPFDATTARRAVDGLRLRPLLDGVRGSAPADIGAYCEAAARLSALAADVGAHIEELDINPVIVHAQGCTGVDALLRPRTQQQWRKAV
jgi:acyl-CoA synthetase (NDP forming)